MFEFLIITCAFCFGLFFRKIGFPPLIGYLASGFFIAEYSSKLGLHGNSNDILEHVSHLGVLLLLFTIGLKLKIEKIFKLEVLGGGILQFIISTAITFPIFYFGFGIEIQKSLLASIALTFSSTVLVAKILEEKKELKAFHGRIAIGLLIIQDLLALLVMSIFKGVVPSYWALLLFGLPLIRPLLYKLLDAVGYDELLVLFGLMVSIGVGGFGFEVVGLSSELGALTFGVILANHRKASELSDSLWSIKEFFLVAFFLMIGKNGFPNAHDWLLAMIMLLLLPLKTIVLFGLLCLFKLKARTSFLTSIGLTNYSEFALIMAAMIMPELLVPLALSVALSFVISSPLNKYAHNIYEKIGFVLKRFQRENIIDAEKPINLGDSEIMIIGMGRVGTAVYREMSPFNNKIIAFDSDQDLVNRIRNDLNINAHCIDVEDKNLWKGLDVSKLKAVIICVNCSEAAITSVQKLRKKGFSGIITAHSVYEETAAEINAAGADATYLTMEEAGVGLTRNTIKKLLDRSKNL